MSNAMEMCKAIFVDYFDTLVFRHVTAKGVLKQWAKALKRIYPELPQETIDFLPDERLKSFKYLRKKVVKENSEHSEITYEEAIGYLYRQNLKELIDDEKKFVKLSKELDFSIECGCQYANVNLVKQLTQEKKKGKKIYIVSDFYLGSEYMSQMMKAANVPENLIDDIFVSCDCGKRKAIGDLYSYVLGKLNIKAEDVVMIGDNKISDYQNAKNVGINAVLQARKIHKVNIHLNEKLKNNFSNHQFKISIREMYSTGKDYSEYIAMFFVFTKRLYSQLVSENVSIIAFMAREGYYLRQLFELYQYLTKPNKDHIKTQYYWCSRRSVMSGVKEALMPNSSNYEISLRNWLKSLNLTIEDVKHYGCIDEKDIDTVSDIRSNKSYCNLMNNKEFANMIGNLIIDNNSAFQQYTKEYIHNGVFRFVDSGWKCTTQNTIETLYGIKTKGYYIGVQIPDNPIADLDAEGLVFNEYKPRSRYYDFLGMNIPFYQQLLAAPHGTALQYVIKGNGVKILSEWDPMEEKLYVENIKKLQEYMLLKFRGLCVWNDNAAFDKNEDWLIAKQSMKSSLFAQGTRLQFIKNCTESYVQNFRQENRGKVKYDYRKAKMGIDILWKPEKYLRYFAKIQRTEIYDHKIVRVLYGPFSKLYFGYVLLWHQAKGRM